MDCVLSDLKNAKLGTGTFKGQRDMEEVLYGGKGLHWAVVPMKKKDIGLTIKTGKTKYMEIGRHQGMISNEHIRISSNSYVNVKP